MTFGSFIKQARQDRGMARSILLFETGLSPKRLTALETGAERPTHEEIDQLALALGASSRTLMACAGYISIIGTMPQKTAQPDRPRTAHRLYKGWR